MPPRPHAAHPHAQPGPAPPQLSRALQSGQLAAPPLAAWAQARVRTPTVLGAPSRDATPRCGRSPMRSTRTRMHAPHDTRRAARRLRLDAGLCSRPRPRAPPLCTPTRDTARRATRRQPQRRWPTRHCWRSRPITAAPPRRSCAAPRQANAAERH
jgi:hypothetical protein